MAETLTKTVSSVVIEPGAQERDPSGYRRRQRNLRILLGWSAPIALMLLWQLAAQRGWVDRRLFSAPTDVFQAAKDLIRSGELKDHVLATLRRVGVGYSLGAVAGVVIGITFGWYSMLRAAFRPLMSALYTIPKLGIYPLFLLIFGLGERAKYFLIMYGIFLVVATATMDSVAKVPTSYLEAARSMNTPRRSLFTEVVLPSALPQIFTTLRVALGMAVLAVIGIEFISATTGIGSLIYKSSTLFRPEDMFVGIVCSALLGLLTNQLLRLIEHVAVPWQRSGGRIVL